MTDNKIGRRKFLETSVKAFAAGAITLSVFDLSGLIAKASEKPEQGSYEKTISLSDYPELQSVGGYAIVTKRVIVIRISQTKFISLNLTCTHKQCEVEYDGESFECPCHGSEYDKYGKVTQGPAKKNLTSYKTEYNAENETLTIHI